MKRRQTKYNINQHMRIVELCVDKYFIKLECQGETITRAASHYFHHQLPHPHTVIYFAPLHHSISTCTWIFCTSITPVSNCYIAIILPLWPIYCLISLILPHLHTLHIDVSYCIIDCMFVYSMYNSVLLFVSHCFALSWPGRSCKWELVLN